MTLSVTGGIRGGEGCVQEKCQRFAECVFLAKVEFLGEGFSPTDMAMVLAMVLVPPDMRTKVKASKVSFPFLPRGTTPADLFFFFSLFLLKWG